MGSLYNRDYMRATHDRERMLATIADAIGPLGYTLLPEQPHISGERALLTEHKMVLQGTDEAGTRVIIKVSWDKIGKAEIANEKHVRDTLRSLSFATDELLEPVERFYGTVSGLLILITEYVEQTEIFVTRPLSEQFFIALRAFEAQEAFHATTYEHRKQIRKRFTSYTSATYLRAFDTYIRDVEGTPCDTDVARALQDARVRLQAGKDVLDRYGDYLTHNDFVPHNMRLNGRDLYVLDHTSFWFGNKYEGWARFINYMVVHNPELSRALIEFVRTNRPAEYEALQLMRLYKLGMLLSYYVRLLPKTEGNLKTLTCIRIALWTRVLEHVLHDDPVPDELISAYIEERSTLRTEEEKVRQREFAVA